VTFDAVVEMSSHPASAGRAARRVAVDVHWSAGARELALRYRLEADADRLLVPAPRTPRRTDGLWRHTCFEAFVQPAQHDGYLEFNFSPSGEWAAYGFDQRRKGMRDFELPTPPRIDCARGAGELELGVTLQLESLPALPLRLGLTAVVEDRDGAIAHWALRHPPGPADFHDPGSFTLRLEPAGPAPAASANP
jgi:hypothetical protein